MHDLRPQYVVFYVICYTSATGVLDTYHRQIYYRNPLLQDQSCQPSSFEKFSVCYINAYGVSQSLWSFLLAV